jgi:PmbA protein
MAIETASALVPEGADLLALVDLALEEARALGAAQAEAAVSMDVGLSVSVRLGEVETIEYQRDRGMGVTVYFGTRKGTASTADLSAATLRETVAKACSIARYTAEDPCAGLADPDTLATAIPDLDLAHPWDITPERACELALECEAAAMAVDPRITNSEGAGVSTHRGVRAYGNTHGFLAAFPGTVHSLSCAVLASAGEQMERDYWYSTARDWRALEGADGVGRASGERAVRRLGARQLGTMKVPVLFAPEVARGLVGHFVGAVRGGSQYRRARPSTRRASRHATASWSGAACCSATCSAPTRPASSACAPRATPAVPTTCWCMAAGATSKACSR